MVLILPLDETLHQSRGETATLDKLPEVVAKHFDGWVVAAALDGRHRRVTRLRAAHSDPSRQAAVAPVTAALTAWVKTPPALLLIRAAVDQLTGTAPLHAAVDADTLSGIAATAGLTGVELTGSDGAALVIAPLTARGVQVGLIALVRDGRTGFDTDELAAIADLGVRAGVAVDNARLYAREHDAALTLQRSLLPRLPTLSGFDVAATYQPAHNQAEVGGDWYDVLDLPGSQGIGVAVGDVMGHDLKAAASMGQLRSVLRSYAWSGDGPAAVIARLDELVRGLDMAALATCVYAIVCPDSPDSPDSPEDRAGGCSVTYTLAGHPPPMIWHPDGHVEHLIGALTSPVGVAGDNRTISQAVTDLPVGAYLVLYTDGLVERRLRDIDDSIDALTQTLKNAPRESTAEHLCTHIVSTLTADDHDDDICVLVLRRTA